MRKSPLMWLSLLEERGGGTTPDKAAIDAKRAAMIAARGA